MAAISTDICQINVLLGQAENAISKAVSDGDMSAADAEVLGKLLGQTAANLTSTKLSQSMPDLTAACAMFD